MQYPKQPNLPHALLQPRVSHRCQRHGGKYTPQPDLVCFNWCVLIVPISLMMHAQQYPTFCDTVDYSTPAPPSMGFSRQEYWSGLPFPPAGDLSDPEIKPMSPMSPALAGRFFTTSATKLFKVRSKLLHHGFHNLTYKAVKATA